MSHHSRFVSREIARLLSANGIYDLDSAFRSGTAVDEEHERRATRHRFRRVVKLALTDAAGSTTVYIKREWGRERWMPRPTDIRHRIGLLCSPIHEWRGLHMLQSAGFHVSEPLALFWRGWGLSRGAVITRAVPPTVSMADMLLHGEFERMEAAKREALIAAAARVVARLHRARISWRSMKAKHFYPEELGGNRWRIWLIDCEGVYHWASRRDCQREWRTYLQYFTAQAPALRDAFLTEYRIALSS
ncbi:MAG TPA: lipopolysaccharide kinase InaA family protein [Lacipirellulaceae bacterium]|nr:lipopolysaccharide kinase InaA family protein [Lacipirellulaceae bacterium]